MATRHLKLDDLRTLNSPDNIASIFQQLGYSASANVLDIGDLGLSPRNQEAVNQVYLIADEGEGKLQILLFELKASEWSSPSHASTRLKSLASGLGKRTTDFLLLATKDYNQLMLVNPRKTFDDTYNLQCSIRKLLIDRTSPTAYDLDRLEAIAVNNQPPEKLYQIHCEAFDVEKLTKQFYNGYQSLFERVQQIVKQYNPIDYFEDEDKLHQFCQRLLGRIMFLYFLQKKGFLNNDPKFLTTQYKVNHYQSEDTDYYSKVLEPLFFETLNQQRPNLEHQWGKGKIPYLNGGLFDRDYGENIKDRTGGNTPHSITLPNSLFDYGDTNSILGFFNQYNFTISENITGDEDVAVDPEMLGKVFENMLASEERGSSGTFYTPRGIVQFMAEEVITRYLVDALTPNASPTGGGEILPETIQKLINYDPDLPDSEFNQLINPTQARAIKEAIASLKILDPAVGSGAFPLGIMQVLLNIKQAVARREGMKIQRGSLTISQWKREIIANNLYGVDIKPEAIEIAKLRMWLSLVVDIPNIEDIEPLPNLDYKLMCGDSLISTIHGEVLIPDPTKTQQGMLAVTPIQQAIQPLLSLQQQYFNADSEERIPLREQIIEAENNIFKVAVTNKLTYLQGQLKDIERKINSLKRPNKKILAEKAEIELKITELTEFSHDVTIGKRSLSFFQYHLHFRDVFESNGGFDIVIGNPPYVRQEAIKDLKPALSQEYKCYTGTADLYIYFYEQGLRLLKENGYLSYISPNKYFKANYGVNLRKYLAVNTQIHNITDFGELPVFDAATFPMIFIAQKRSIEKQSTVLFTQVKSLESPYPNIYKIVKKQGQILPDTAIKEDNWTLTDQNIVTFLNKLTQKTITLNQYISGFNTKIYVGIKTGFNKAFWINESQRKDFLLEDKKNNDIIKPLIVGDDIRKWNTKINTRYIILTKIGIEIEKYPVIFEYLKTNEERLKKRSDQGNYWWELRNCAYYSEFLKPKIIFPDIAKEPRFTYSEEENYIDMTGFFIPIKDLYLLGILNSQYVWNYLRESASVLGDNKKGGRLRLKRQYIEKIPIPQAEEKEKEVIEKLVEKCLNAKGVNCEQWEAEIDDIVADLYGLSEEEKVIIKGE
ncbi:Eco57I restriction-modification methylase domain-containing protein [Cyanobacterium aponinum]|uniref:site-specific DNA-methyltransferase (adenine-specific) n=1 Tax=Cyanobacterium aponinum 0216 TaxID=2676140 RepID=A0A844GRF6_9CHRO|nr:TaqI-like C-terminal specificity domain-containing protein [Cyanobacterium aponinum]MTF37509.1 type II restriction endonuclease [Cyanobacterium aponinum 0216]